MNIKCWKAIKSLFELADQIDDIGLGVKNITDSDKSTKQVMQLEMQGYFLSMFAHNGGVGEDEIDFFNFYFDTEWKSSIASQLVNEVLPLAEKFVKDSFICAVLIDADNKLIKIQPNTDISILDTYITVLKGLTSEALKVDENWRDERKDFAFNYFGRLKNLIFSRHNRISMVESLNDIPSLDNKASSPVSNETSTPSTLISQEKNLADLLNDLNSLVGLSAVKEDVSSLVNLLKIRKVREEHGLTLPPLSLHLVFSGNPGTGKTTVARLLAQIYKELGILSKGHLVEVDRSKLVGGYVGQTAIKVQDAIQSALGGILFIDEAYSLTNKGENDYGSEAIDTLVKGMEDNRSDLVVIVAGYPDLMADFLNSNPGLRSRFNKFLYFADYTASERVEIFEGMAQKSGYELTSAAIEFATTYFEKQCECPDNSNANARGVRNFFEKAIVNQANRLASISTNLSDDDLTTITLDDFTNIA